MAQIKTNLAYGVTGTIPTANIADDAITSAKLADDSVVAAAIADNAVVTAAINADAITAAKVADDVINSEHLVDGGVDDAHLATGISSSKLSGALPAISGASLTTLNASNVSSGTLNTARYVDNEGGITEADTWRVNTSLNVSAGQASLTANWERDDTFANGLLGTGMSESSGVFTFPSTGFWQVVGNIGFINDNGGLQAKYLGAAIEVTTNNSSYSEATNSYNSNAPESSSIYSFARTSKILDVTDTANIKVKLMYLVQQNFAISGNTARNNTYLQFIKLGDT